MFCEDAPQFDHNLLISQMDFSINSQNSGNDWLFNMSTIRFSFQ